MKCVFFFCMMTLLFAPRGPAQQPSATPSKQAADKPKRKLDTDLSGFDVSDDKSGKKVSTMLGGSRSAAVPSATLLAPHCAKFYGASADLLWSFSGHNEGYIVLITDEDETQIVRQQVKDTRYRVNAPSDKLQPGETYYWRVQVLPNTLASDPLEFVVVSADERHAIDQAIAAIPNGDPYESGLARARVLVDHRLWFDALGAYNDLIAKYPNRADLYQDRATIYAQIPATKSLSDADSNRATSLSKAP
jgi:Domain of Unknown Function (DUF928)